MSGRAGKSADHSAQPSVCRLSCSVQQGDRGLMGKKEKQKKEEKKNAQRQKGAASAAGRPEYVEPSRLQTQRTPHGLYNQGATCYLNSVLQVLSVTTEIHDRLDSRTDFHLKQLFEDLKEKTCDTKAITRSLGITDVYQQRDAAECLEMILQKISPQASEVFQGELRYTAKCLHCNIVYEKTDSAWIPLSLTEGDDTTFTMSFESILQTKSLTGDKKLYCNQCGETVTSFDREMVKSPQILTVLLKRFDFSKTFMSHFKPDRCVDVPHSLEIQDKTYELYGMVDHRDRFYSRHYTATILSNEDQTWYRCDDSEVSRVEESLEKSWTLKSKTACLLLYRAVQPQMSCEASSDGLIDTKDEEKTQMRHTDVGAASAAGRPEYVEPWRPQTQRTPHGLYNQGATCYLNSVLQVLSVTTEMHDRLDSRKDLHLKQLFEDLKKRTCETKTITRRLGITDVHQQRDAAECLEMILQKISPQASEVFQGDLKYTTKCSDSHSINEETNAFWTLPLSLIDDDDTTLSVERSLESILQTQSFTGDNKVFCNQCDKATSATSACEMVKSPQILTVLLKRFDFSNTFKSHFKSDRCVDVPRSLKIQDKKYKLYGMVHHMGSLHCGHYTATILSNEDQTWYRCDDSKVSRVKEPFEKSWTLKSRTACLLLYRAVQPQMSCEASSDGLTDTKDEEKTQMRHTGVGAASAAGRSEYVEPPRPQTQRTPHGLYNQGATCYLNSVLQVLFMTTEIHDRLDSRTDFHLKQLFEDLKEKTCETKTITRRLGITDVYQQRDAAECLEMILQKISPQASEVFRGELRYTAKCPKCNSVYKKTDSAWIPLSLTEGDDTTLTMSFESILQTKSLTGDKKLYCNQCDKAVTPFDCEMVKSPQILTVGLKRFDFSNSIMSRFKSDRCVDVPPSLKIQDKKYKLYGMVDHVGSRYNGRYTATIRSNEDQAWYRCDDSTVSRVEEPFEKSRTLKSKTACLLLYRAVQPQMSCGTSSEGLTDTKDEEKTQMRHTGVGAASAAERTENVEPPRLQTLRTPHGLYNQGATCYLNSVLQVLFMTTEIHDRLDSRTDLLLKQLFEDLKEKTCDTEPIRRRLGITDVHQQRDAAECLEMILQNISPQASEVFQGELRYTAKCLHCYNINEERDPFRTLPLSLMDDDDTTLSVKRSFESILQTKSLIGDKKLYCNQCDKTVTSFDCEMVKSPQILTVGLKRFDFSNTFMSRFKSDRCVDVPPELQIKDKKYKLYGMVDHTGSRYNGHYTATIRSNEDQAWYRCDDLKVSRVEEPFEKSWTLRSRTACLLLYRAVQPQMSCGASSDGLTGGSYTRADQRASSIQKTYF